MEQIYNINKRKGTIKQVGIEEVVQEALDKGVDTISVISSGNYLDALSEEIERKGAKDRLRVVNLVNKPRRKSDLELQITNKRILRDAQERESYVKEKLPDAGKVKDYTDFMPSALNQKAEQMLASHPDYISLGVGTGKLFVALYRKIKEKGLNTKLIGVVPKKENGVFNDNNLVKDTQGNLHYKKFKPKTLADKLSTPYTSYKEEILQAKKEGHPIIQASNRDFKKAHRQAANMGYQAEPSGSAGFVLGDEKTRKKYGIKDNSRILIVNTGKGHQEVVPFRVYRSMLKPAAAAAAALLLAFGIHQGVNRYQQHSLEHKALTGTSRIAAEMVNQDIDTHQMSNKALSKYLSNVKKEIGGPAHYW